MSDLDDRAPGPRAPRKLAVDLSEIADGIENNTLDTPFFLDLDTGKVVFITEDARFQHDEIVQSMGEVDPAQWTQAFEAALAELDLPDWEEESVREADLVESEFGHRFIRLPEADAHEGYADMEAFIETLTNERLAESLRRAIQGRGAFRRYKDVLLDHPKERERWFAFQVARQRERVLEWLQSEGIEPDSARGE